jgi:hypothetical protein
MIVGLKEKRKRIVKLYGHYELARKVLSKHYKDKEIVDLIKAANPGLPCSYSLFSKYNKIKQSPDYFKAINETTFEKIIEAIQDLIFFKLKQRWDVDSSSYVTINPTGGKPQTANMIEKGKIYQSNLHHDKLVKLMGIWQGIAEDHCATIGIADSLDDFHVNFLISDQDVQAKTKDCDLTLFYMEFFSQDTFTMTLESKNRKLHVIGIFEPYVSDNGTITLEWYFTYSGPRNALSAGLLWLRKAAPERRNYDKWRRHAFDEDAEIFNEKKTKLRDGEEIPPQDSMS